MAPTYDLRTVHELIRNDRYKVTGSALLGMADLGFDREDIEQCILALKPSDFKKSDESEQLPGLFLDIYKPRYCGRMLYVKLQIIEDPRPLIVVSFKRK